MALTNIPNLRRYLNNGYNVLFSGEHGIGKTAIIKQVFEEAGLKWAYFSASTLDPWTDLIGVPKEIVNPLDPNTKVLGFIRPEMFENDVIEAIFFDELNRADTKVLNAIMELIQFRSINGHKLKNLKVIWAAINPDDDKGTYNVGYLDPAQMDRFQVRIDLKTDIDTDFFKKKYPLIAGPCIQWWNEMPPDIRKEVSPRRLDYIADALMKQCRLEDFVTPKANVSKLRTLIGDVVSLATRLEKALVDEATALKLLADPNAMLKLAGIDATGAKKLALMYEGKVSGELLAAKTTTNISSTPNTFVDIIEDELKSPNPYWFKTLPAAIDDLQPTENEIKSLSDAQRAKVVSGLSEAMKRLKGETLKRYFIGDDTATLLITPCTAVARVVNLRNVLYSSTADRFRNLTQGLQLPF